LHLPQIRAIRVQEQDAKQIETLRVATATPPHRFSQRELLALAGYEDPRRRGFFEKSGIEGRYLYLDPATFRPDETVDETMAVYGPPEEWIARIHGVYQHSAIDQLVCWFNAGGLRATTTVRGVGRLKRATDDRFHHWPRESDA